MMTSAAESTQDAYGFDLDVPDSFDPNDGVNPYGSAAVTGHVNFNPVRNWAFLSRPTTTRGAWR